MPAESYDSLVRQGAWASASLGLLGAVLLMVATLSGLPGNPIGLVFLVGGSLGSTLAMAWLWPRLVARRGNFSLPLAALAGILAALSGHLAAWLAFFVVTLIVGDPTSLRDILRAFLLVLTMSGMSVLMIGKFTLPLAVAIATGVALWCRWQNARGIST